MSLTADRFLASRPRRPRQTLRLVHGETAPVVLDPLMGDAHDLASPTEQMWAALQANDEAALVQTLALRPDVEAPYQPTEQDWWLMQEHKDFDWSTYEPQPEPRPLEFCLRVDRLALARNLLKAGANPNVQNGKGYPLIVQAMDAGVEVLQALLDGGVDLDFDEMRFGESPWIRAIRYQRFEMATRLIDAGAPLGVPPKSEQASPNHVRVSPLFVALNAMAHRTAAAEDLVERLLKAGAQADHVSSDGQNALHALPCSCSDWVDRLIGLGADAKAPNAQGYTPLHAVIRWLPLLAEQHSLAHAHIAMMQALMRHGADLNVMDRHDTTPLSMALSNRASLVVVRWMLEQGADPDLGGENSARRQTFMKSRGSNVDTHHHRQILALMTSVEEARRLAAVAAAATQNSVSRPRL